MALPPIRPNLPPVTPSVAPSDKTRAAQRAFFNAALGKVETPVAPPAAAAPVTARAAFTPEAAIAREGAPLPRVHTTTPPDPNARPGSRLNIRV
jgi:hypothetical protein